MSAINPTSGIGSPQWTGVAATGKESPSAKASFAQTVKQCVAKAENDQQTAATAIEDLLAGRSQDVLPVVSAVAKADLSFKLLMGVRNKVIEAYKQTMNMQI